MELRNKIKTPDIQLENDVQSDQEPIEKVLDFLGTNATSGLSQKDAEERQKLHGFNEVSEKKDNLILKFLKKFWGLTAWMLELIIALSILLKKFEDVAVVSVLLIVNAVISFAQEKRASDVLDSLRQRLQINIRVLRENEWQTIPARELVPGDIIRLRMGNMIPADLRLIKGTITVDQSAITGESVEVEKESGDELFSGSVVRRGEGTCVVLLTGKHTYFGRTTELIQIASPKLHIESIVSRVVKWLFVITTTLIALVVVVTLYRGLPLLDVVPLLLVILMSAIPVALPVMFNVSLSIGSADLAKEGVLVTRLSATEDAANMDVLCVDKTGTLTQNKLAITEVIPIGNATKTEVIISGVLASHTANNDPIDRAFIELAEQMGLSNEARKFKRLAFIPFNMDNRRTEAVFENDGNEFHVMKGAVDTLAAGCHLSEDEMEKLTETLYTDRQPGFRSLAVSRGIKDGPMKIIGLVIISDPLRKDAKQLIEELNDLGVSVKMLTGDSLKIAREIGRDLGLQKIISIKDIDKSNNGKKTNYLEGADGLAEVYPEDKYTVVKQLQSLGHIVGMTGDGVNDAPALKQAEVGIAVQSASDVAKGAASVVLTESGLLNLITLIKQGRKTYQRILTWVINKISRTILKSAFVAFSYLITGEFAVSAFAMLLMVLLNDAAKISIATDNVRPSHNPETWKIGGFVAVAIVAGLLMVVESLGLMMLFIRFLAATLPVNAIHTFSFLTMLYMAAFSIISIRERRSFWSSKPSKPLIIALVLDALMGTAISYVGIPGLIPLPWWLIAAIMGCVIIAVLGINDALKVLMIKWLIPSSYSLHHEINQTSNFIHSH